MKVLIIASVFLFGCSHAYVKDWRDGKITTCCPEQKLACTADNLAALAAKQCGGAVRPISGYSYVAGATASHGISTSSIHSTQDICTTFVCMENAEQENKQ